MKGFLTFCFLVTLLSRWVQTSNSINNSAKEVVVKGNHTVPRFPPDGYQYFPGIGYYKMNDRREEFLNAEILCEQDGAHLAIINSQGEANALVSVYSQIYTPGVGGVRVGFGDFFGKGDFRTIFGEPLSSTGYMVWYPGQPITPNERNCGSMNIEGTLEIDCCENCYRYYVCEIELPSSN